MAQKSDNLLDMKKLSDYASFDIVLQDQ